MTNVLILDENKHALMICNFKHGKDRWEFPGGKVEDGETLESSAVKEPFQELNIRVKLKGVFGDYKTQTPEGPFLCRTYFADIIEGEPKIMEPKIHKDFMQASYNDLLKLKEEGTLVPNLVAALPKLEKYIS